MRVQELITLLSAPGINLDAEVLVWLGDERYALNPALPVDQWSPKFLDLNVIDPLDRQGAA